MLLIDIEKYSINIFLSSNKTPKFENPKIIKPKISKPQNKQIAIFKPQIGVPNIIFNLTTPMSKLQMLFHRKINLI